MEGYRVGEIDRGRDIEVKRERERERERQREGRGCERKRNLKLCSLSRWAYRGSNEMSAV